MRGRVTMADPASAQHRQQTAAAVATTAARSPLKTKVIRSQKIITAFSPTDTEMRSPGGGGDRDGDGGSSAEMMDRTPPIPRSHTPGHLSTKSQGSRRKPSELSIRQRSQSASSASPSHAPSSVPPPSATSATSAKPSLSATSATTPTPTSSHSLHPNDIYGASSAYGGRTSSLSPNPSPPGNGDASTIASSSSSSTRDRDRQDSSVTDKDSTTTSMPRRPTGMRSTSAIASKPRESASTTTLAGTPGTSASTTSLGGAASASSSVRTAMASSTRGSNSRHGPSRHQSQQVTHTAFPALVNPRTAPDVPPAPSSGMYWSRAPVSGISRTAVRAHTTTLAGSNIYVFGGCDSRTCFNQLYVLDADSFYWSAPHVIGELPVPLRAMTCTAVGKKLVVFGGGDGPTYYNDVYVLDTVNFRWSKPRVLSEKIPSKRRAHTACLYKNGIYVFGGGDGVRALNDVWRLDVSDMSKMSWRQISGSSEGTSVAVAAASTSSGGSREVRPKARGYHTANIVGSKIIVYGGSDGNECFNDVWVYDVETGLWRGVNIPLTYRRLSHTATIVGSYLFVIGGHDGDEYSNDVLLLNLVTMTWDRRKVYGIPPSGRGYHGTVLYDSRLLVIGGFDGGEVFSDVWLLELAVHAYYSQISHFTIEV